MDFIIHAKNESESGVHIRLEKRKYSNVEQNLSGKLEDQNKLNEHKEEKSKTSENAPRKIAKIVIDVREMENSECEFDFQLLNLKKSPSQKLFLSFARIPQSKNNLQDKHLKAVKSDLSGLNDDGSGPSEDPFVSFDCGESDIFEPTGQNNLKQDLLTKRKNMNYFEGEPAKKKEKRKKSNFDQKDDGRIRKKEFAIEQGI